MAFSVEDFHDLVRLLDQHPEWRAELRRLVLTEELLRLPAIVAELAEAQRQSAVELAELRQAVTELRQTAAEQGEQFRQLTRVQSEMRDQFGGFQGEMLERRYRDYFSAYFARVVRRPRLVSQQQLADLLDDAVDAGQLTEAERNDVMLADVVVRGRRQPDGAEVYLVVEVSVGIGLDDVERAAQRAGVLGRLVPTLAAVAGKWIAPEASDSAVAHNVWRVLDGRALPPSQR